MSTDVAGSRRAARPGTIAGFALGFAVLMGLAACAPGTDGIVITETAVEDNPVIDVTRDGSIQAEVPLIPVVKLPDLSSVGEYESLLQERLGSLGLKPLEGVEVLNVECDSDGIIYQGDESSDIFENADIGYGESFSFEIDPVDGSAVYFREDFTHRTRIKTSLDGSGEFVDQGTGNKLSIQTEADGSGEYFHNTPTTTTTVAADADGAGVFYRKGLEALLTVTIRDDGSGALFSENDEGLLTVDAHGDGSGEMYFKQGDRVVTLLVRADRSWELLDQSFGHAISIKVNADGTGQYRERGTGPAVTLNFAADGSTIGPEVVLPPAPLFAVADRFPPLGTLASITPPCATVVRFDSELLFEFNQATIKPEAAAVLAEFAPALIEADRAIEINGHTDATGTEEYNLDLSKRRAQAVADELRSLGVAVEMTINGFGESQPIAPNYRADGSDDEAGQRQNRRVELVIHD